MTTKHKHDRPILVTGAAGAVGGIGRNLTEFLLTRGNKVRALVRREDARAEALRRLGAEVVEGDLTNLASMHRAIEGCGRIYFGMSVSAAYLEATINTAAVARHHGVEAFVNMSQMTVTQMSINETTDSPQHKLHWLAEQALAWSGSAGRHGAADSLPRGLLSYARRRRRAGFRRVGAADGRWQDLANLGGRCGARGSCDPRRPRTAYRTNLRSDGAGIGQSALLPARFLRGARQAHPISRRPTPGVERRPSAGGVSRARCQPSLGHDRAEQAERVTTA